MAPKNRTLSLQTQPLPATTQSANIQSYYTAHILMELIDADGKTANGVAISIADSKSLQIKDAQRHPLSALTKDAMAAMKLPKTPAGVTVVYGLLGPLSKDNPAGTASWCWTFAAAAKNKAAIPTAMKFAVDFLTQVLDQAYLNANLTVPAGGKHGAFTVVSRAIGDRVEVSRSFSKADGSPMTVKEMTNFHVVTTKNFPSRPRLMLQRYMQKHGKLFATSTCAPRTAMVDTVAAPPQTQFALTMKTKPVKATKVAAPGTMKTKVMKVIKVMKTKKVKTVGRK